MTTEQEAKLLKSLGIFTLLVFLPLNIFVIKNDIVKLLIFIPILVLFSILYVRQYKRDKAANKDLSRYKMLLFFLGISLLMLVAALVYPSI